MNQQVDAFDRVAFPRAHTNDPRSSHEAAARGEKTGLFKRQAEKVLGWVKRYPQATSAELHRIAGDPALDLYAFRRRLDDMNKVNLVQRIDPTDAMKPCEISGKRVCRWVAK